MFESYWTPSEIRFTKEQVLWLLPHLEELREGLYPANHKETGYVGGNGKNRRTSPFETICLIAAEIDIRLAACFPDGILVEEYYTKGHTYESLASKYHRDTYSIHRAINNALSYISSGSSQRWHRHHKDPCTYAEWKGHYRTRKVMVCS